MKTVYSGLKIYCRVYLWLIFALASTNARAQTEFATEMAKLRGNVFSLHGHALQVLERGVVVSQATFTPVKIDERGKFAGLGERTTFPAPVYLEIDPAKFVEGAIVDEKITFDFGSFPYTDTNGAKRKIQAVTSNRQHALEYLRSKSR